MAFKTEGLFEVGIEGWPKWNFNPHSLKSFQQLQPTEPSGHEFNSHSEPTFYS